MLVVGGGAGADLAHWRALQPQRLVVCEPQPALADELLRKLRADAGETLVRGAIAAADGTLTLQLLNNPRESGVQPPTGLLAHQPRLQVQTTLAVPAQTLWQMAEALQLSADAPHLLVLDAPGQASAILQPSLAALQRFEWLVLRTGTEALYAGDAPCTDLLAMLQAAAYDLVADDPDTLPPHRELLLRRNPQRLQALQTQAALASASEALQQQQTDIAELAAVNAGLEATLADWAQTIERLEAHNETQAQQLAECQAEAAELTQAQQTHHELARQQQAQWALERLAQLESVAVRDAVVEKAAGDHEAQTKAARQAQAAAEDLAAERQSQLEALTQEAAALSQAHDEQTKLAGEQAAQIASLQEAKAVAEQSVAHRQEQINAMALELDELANAREQASQYQADVAALTESLQAHQDAAKLRQDQWAAERSALLESVAAGIAKADKAAAEQGAQIHAMTQELAALAKAREEQAQLAGDRAEQIAAIAQAKTAAESAAAERQAQFESSTRDKVEQIDAFNEQASVAAERIKQITSDLEFSQQATNFAVKTQALREADLRDLQSRYQIVLQEQQRQHDLLTKLAERLATANEYWHQLNITQTNDDRLEVATQSMASRAWLALKSAMPRLL